MPRRDLAPTASLPVLGTGPNLYPLAMVFRRTSRRGPAPPAPMPAPSPAQAPVQAEEGGRNSWRRPRDCPAGHPLAVRL